MEEIDDPSVLPFKAPADVTIPPKAIRNTLEKSAEFVVRRGVEYEQRMLTLAKENPQLQFILSENPYHSYYQWRKTEIAAGRGLSAADGTGPGIQTKKGKQGPTAPPEFHFSARMPTTISAVDLDVVKLTAQFVAIKGPSWTTKFSQTYGQNAQFAFLRPQNSLNQFFNRLVDQYRELNSDNTAGQKARLEELDLNVKDKYHILGRAKQRAEWVKHQEAQKIRKEEESDAEKIAYAQIDWHDFAVVATIEFTDSDEQADLPAPQTLNDLQSASLEQKAAFGAAPGMMIEEAMPEDMEFWTNPHQQPQQQPQHLNPIHPSPPATFSQVPPPAPHPHHLPTPPLLHHPSPFPPPSSISPLPNPSEPSRPPSTLGPTGPIRIRENYTPRALQARQAAATTVLCRICGQQIEAAAYNEHVRIEQLDPRWREQTRIAQQRSSTTNLSTFDVANNLKRLASQRDNAALDDAGRDAKRIDLNGAASSSAGMNMPVSGPEVMVGQQQVQQQQPQPRSLDVQEQLRLLQSKYGQQPPSH